MASVSNIELRHILDLAEKSYRNNQFTFTSFLTPAQMSDFYDSLNMLPPCGYEVSGGYEGFERGMIRFGNPADLGYEEEFPIKCLRIEPLIAKFADELTHRDVLGSIMNLGMERENLGDILIKDNKIFVLCMPSLAQVIGDELTRIRHTSVKCSVCETMPPDLKPTFERITIQAASERLDGVVSKICRISRNASALLFTEGKVAINGREMKNHSYQLKESDTVSVRGYGKFRYVGITGTTKKGNQMIALDKFI